MSYMINNKTLFDCNEDDFQLILDNPDYREDENVDYKVSFSIDEYPKEKKEERQRAIAELRSDVCAFANTTGGYIIYGIKEDGKGIPQELTGIAIRDNNTDKFELNFSNWTQNIDPRRPNYKLRFLQLNNGRYLVIVFIKNDFFAPYLHVENEKDYKIYKRVGNHKEIIPYSELKNMFTQSISFENEIVNFRNDRISFFSSQEDDADHSYSVFLLLHIIPDTFLDSHYDNSMFALERKRVNLSSIFYGVDCDTYSIPMIRGLRFLGRAGKSECRLYDNGVAECFYPIYDYLNVNTSNYEKGFLDSGYLYDRMARVIRQYIDTMKQNIGVKKLYVCATIMGCKNVITARNDWFDVKGLIDRDDLICEPVLFNDISDDNSVSMDLKRFQLNYALSLGIKIGKTVNELYKELYGE